MVVFVIFSKAKKELVLIFWRVGGKVGPNKPYIEASLILKYILAHSYMYDNEDNRDSDSGSNNDNDDDGGDGGGGGGGSGGGDKDNGSNSNAGSTDSHSL